jgi:hypothetical protein
MRNWNVRSFSDEAEKQLVVPTPGTGGGTAITLLSLSLLAGREVAHPRLDIKPIRTIDNTAPDPLNIAKDCSRISPK